MKKQNENKQKQQQQKTYEKGEWGVGGWRGESIRMLQRLDRDYEWRKRTPCKPYTTNVHLSRHLTKQVKRVTSHEKLTLFANTEVKGLDHITSPFTVVTRHQAPGFPRMWPPPAGELVTVACRKEGAWLSVVGHVNTEPKTATKAPLTPDHYLPIFLPVIPTWCDPPATDWSVDRTLARRGGQLLFPALIFLT